MLCERCRKNLATARYAEVVDGTVRELNLCAECLSKHSTEASAGFELVRPGPAKRRHVPSQMQRGAERARCKCCGQILGKVLENSKMGCAACYETFSEHIEGVIKGLHGQVRHRGKSPDVDDERARVRTDLQTKRTLLRSALGTENYEEAARLRDEIRVLEQELSAAEERV